MNLETLIAIQKSACLGSKDIRRLNREGKIIGSLPDKLSPSSLDLTLSNEMFIIDTHDGGIITPKPNQTVADAMALELPGRLCRTHTMGTEGMRLFKDRGFAYLVRLSEKIILEKNEVIRSSPKSTTGRCFARTRLIADFNPCFEEIAGSYCSDTPINMYLLIEPDTFDIVVAPGVQLNQIRFFQNFIKSLNPEELEAEININPLLYDVNNSSVQHKILDFLEMHVDLEGKHTDGVIGFRAKHTLELIDFTKPKNFYNIEDFFEPLIANRDGSLLCRPGDRLLLPTIETLKVPNHLSIEVSRYGNTSVTGPVDYAGFVDNGFEGQLVLEMRIDEQTSRKLYHGQPICKVQVFRTSDIENPYNNDYQQQKGPRAAKFFKVPDFKILAKTYDRLSKKALVHNASRIQELHLKSGTESSSDAFRFADSLTEAKIKALLSTGSLHSRYDCESDEKVIQFIPYVLLFTEDKKIFTYKRSTDRNTTGESRLHGKTAIGLGSHIESRECYPTLDQYAKDTINKEVTITGHMSPSLFIGTLYTDTKEVDKHHFGLVFASLLVGSINHIDHSIASHSMEPFNALEAALSKENINQAACIAHEPQLESWTQILIPHLDRIYTHLVTKNLESKNQ